MRLTGRGIELWYKTGPDKEGTARQFDDPRPAVGGFTADLNAAVLEVFAVSRIQLIITREGLFYLIAPVNTFR